MFIATSGFDATGAPEVFWTAVEPHSQINTASGVIVLSLVVIVLSNVVSNVPTGIDCLCRPELYSECFFLLSHRVSNTGSPL
jgi:hypothetical protein